MALSLKSGEQRVLMEGGAFGRWAPTGHLLFARGGKLLAAPFDLEKVAVTGSAVPVLEDVFLEISDGYSPLGFGANGTLVYAPESVFDAGRRLAWVDRQGELTPLDLPEKRYGEPRLAPDGRHVAVSIRDGQNADIWIYDRERGTSSRFTFAASTDFNPIWSPDGRTVFYNGEDPQFTIYRRPADGSRETELLLHRSVDTTPTSVSPDGKWLVFTQGAVETNNDLWLLPLKDAEEPRLFLQTAFDEAAGMISPDGQWLAYQSDESGRDEIYAMPFPDGGARVQISIAGGANPVWSPRGNELFFQQLSQHMVVTIDRERTTATDLVVSRPQTLFAGEGREMLYAGTDFSPTQDAQRLLIAHTPDEAQPRTLRVVVNWFSELE
jgi:serine/threonine-protein kinase